MKVAVQFLASDETPDVGLVAHEAEMRGFDGIYFPEHTHQPVDHKPMPYEGHGDREIRQRRMMSPFVAMAWAASTTKKMPIGTCVALPAQHDPIVLAKTLASLDLMAKGRIVYGFGFGWSEEEMRSHGVDPKRRRATTREKMLAAKALWTQEQASFSGEFVNFPPSYMWPKPVQKPHLPILLGAAGTDQVFDHVIEYCDGWMPGVRPTMLEDIKRLRTRAAEKGRDPKTIPIDIIPREKSVKIFEQFRDAGVRRVILHIPYGGMDEIRRGLDDYVKQYVRVFHET